MAAVTEKCISFLAYLMVKAGLSERRKDGRFPSRGLEVSYWTGGKRKWAKVKDISATGVYLLTDDRLIPGTALQLTLQKRSLLERDAAPQVRLRALCARLGADGMGLTFAHEPERAAEWSKSMAFAGKMVDASHPVKLFRATKAIAFLLRIRALSETQVTELMTGANSEKADRISEIALRAEELVTSRGVQPQAGLTPTLALRVLEYGSKAGDERLLQGWAGLLASFCLDLLQDDSLVRYVVLMSKLDGDHMSILKAACTRAMRADWGTGFEVSATLLCPAEELLMTAGVPNLPSLERDLNYLHQYGLMGKTLKPPGCAELDQVNITPTSLGLKLYARCCGYTDPAEMREAAPLQLAS